MGAGGTTSSSLIAKNTLPVSEAKVGISPGWYNAKVAKAGAAITVYGSVALTPGTTPGIAGAGAGTTGAGAVIFAVVFPTIGAQQVTGRAKLLPELPTVVGTIGPCCVKIKPV